MTTSAAVLLCPNRPFADSTVLCWKDEDHDGPCDWARPHAFMPMLADPAVCVRCRCTWGKDWHVR